MITTVAITYRFTYTQDDCDYLGIPSTVEAMLTNAREAVNEGIEATTTTIESRQE